MLRFAPKLLLVATAFAPVMLTTAAVEYWKASSRSQGLVEVLPLLLGAVLALIICVLVMHKAKSELPKNPVSIKSIKPADKELIGFVLAYLLPLARGTLFEGFSLTVVLAVFFLVVMTSNAYHTNPLLGLLGWHFYEVVIDEVGYILVSRRNIHGVRTIKTVVSLTDYMLLDATL